MKKLTKYEKRTLQSIANQIQASVNVGRTPDLSPKESKLMRKLAMYYEVDPNSFKLDWMNCFPDMDEQEATYTMYHAFNGLNNKIEKIYKGIN